MKNTKSLYSLDVVTDEPPFESFALIDAPSILGRDNFDEDITPGFEMSGTEREWKPVFFKDRDWKAPKVVGRVPEFQNFSSIDFVLPVFNKKACEILNDFLTPNGELLSIDSPNGDFYFYNVTRVLDALDVKNSDVEFWCDPPTSAIDIRYFSFKENVIEDHSIFRFIEDPMRLVVTDQFVKIVRDNKLTGFHFDKIWPLPEASYWRDYKEDEDTSEKELNGNTVIITLNFSTQSRLESKKNLISKSEDALDRVLAVKEIDDKYYGTYEGHDVVDNQYRIFISCPNADELIEKLSSDWLKDLNYANVQLYKRLGGMYDEDAIVELVEL